MAKKIKEMTPGSATAGAWSLPFQNEADAAGKRLEGANLTAAIVATLANAINSNHVQNGSITGTDLANETITSANVQNHSLTGTDLANETITSANVQNFSLTGTDLANETITSANIQNFSLTGNDLANQTLTPAKLAPSAVAGQLIVSSAGSSWANVTVSGNVTLSAAGVFTIGVSQVQTSMIANGAITADKLAESLELGDIQPPGGDLEILIGNESGGWSSHPVSGDVTLDGSGVVTIANATVTEAKIANNAVTSGKIADDAVTEDKIADGAVTEDKIADGAVAGGKIANLAIGTVHIGEVDISAFNNDAGYLDGIPDDSVTTDKMSSALFSGSFDTATETITVVNGVITTVAPL